MKIKYLLFCVALLLPIIAFAGSTSIQQSLIDLAAKRDRYLVGFNPIIKNTTTTVERFEGKGTQAQTSIDDYFIVTKKNIKGKTITSYKIKAPYNQEKYPDENKGEFPESFSSILNISPSSKYIYFHTTKFETSYGYLIRLSDGKVMYKFESTYGRVTRTPDRQIFIVGGSIGMGVDSKLFISHKSDITKYLIIDLGGDTRSMIANNKIAQVYVIRYENNEDGEGYIEEYDLETGKLISSKKI